MDASGPITILQILSNDQCFVLLSTSDNLILKR